MKSSLLALSDLVHVNDWSVVLKKVGSNVIFFFFIGRPLNPFLGVSSCSFAGLYYHGFIVKVWVIWVQWWFKQMSDLNLDCGHSSNWVTLTTTQPVVLFNSFNLTVTLYPLQFPVCFRRWTLLRVSTVWGHFHFCLPICDVTILPNESTDYTPSVPFLSEVGHTQVWSELEWLQVVLKHLFPLLQMLTGCNLVVEIWFYVTSSSHINF